MNKLILLGFILFANLATAQTDYEVWTTFNASGTLDKKENLKLIIEGEDRYSHKTNDIKYFHYDIGLSYKLSDKFSVGAFYREIYANGIDFTTRIPQPHIDGFYKLPIGFKLRTRVEYQIFEDLDNQFRFRIRPAWQFKFWDNFNPFIQSEVFIAQKYVLTRNRLSVGSTIKFGKIEIQPSWTFESNNKDIWTNRNILWVNTKFKF